MSTRLCASGLRVGPAASWTFKDFHIAFVIQNRQSFVRGSRCPEPHIAMQSKPSDAVGVRQVSVICIDHISHMTRVAENIRAICDQSSESFNREGARVWCR